MSNTKMPCPRVQIGIECPECGYPASEALYLIDDNGWTATNPITYEYVYDPGHLHGEVHND